MKYVLMLVITFIISCVMTPVAIKLAPKVGAIDVPKDARRMHTKPMPRFGGFAMFVATEIGLIALCLGYTKMMTVILGGVLIYAVGVYDDIKGMRAKVKFLLQMLCAAFVYIGGVRIEFVRNPFNQEAYIHFPMIVSFFITVIWIVGITNTINLIDGLDGLAAGVAAIASASIAYTAVLSGQYGVGLAMLAVTGSAMGFLPFNFHPAKTFMGDSGSLYLGFMIATISTYGSTKGATLIATIVPFLVLGVPIFDTAFAIIRRSVNGRPVMSADKGHLHHRIINTGIGQRRTVLIMYCISAIMGIIAILFVQRIYVEVILLSVVAVLLTCIFIADQPSLSEILKEGIPQEDNTSDGSADADNTEQ